jgi:signal transduction histidine kinase
MDASANEMLEEFRLTDSKKQKFEYQYDNNCLEFWADERLIRQILTNLLSNAIKYSPEKSTISLTLSCDKEHATLQVKDQGIGIPQSDQKHIFDQFTRASNVGAVSGTGMGLAIVHRSVKLHKGNISFESEDGKGTTFTVTLPMSLTEEIPVVEGILE